MGDPLRLQVACLIKTRAQSGLLTGLPHGRHRPAPHVRHQKFDGVGADIDDGATIVLSTYGHEVATMIAELAQTTF